MIEIDGSFGEGGGQILRTSLALSALTGKEVKLYNIRAKRKNPGLRPQHLNAVKAVASLCDAEVKGLKIGSKEIIFRPNEIKSKHLDIDIGTAGSTILILHALLPAAIHSKKEFTFNVIGGTHVKWSPPYEHFKYVFLEYLKKAGAKVECEILRYGFYPKGGGRVKLRIKPAEMKKIKVLERGGYLGTNVYSIASKDLKKREVAERQLKAFKKSFDLKINEENIIYVDSFSTGSIIEAHACFENCILSAEILGEKEKKSEELGKLCSQKLMKEVNSDATVDVHTADQLIPYVALYGGTFKFRELTGHLKTNIWVCEKFLPIKFEIEGNIISCNL